MSQPAPKSSWLLGVSDVMDRLGVSQSLVYALCDRGDLEYIKVGKFFKFTPESIAAFLDVNTRKIAS